MIIIVLHDLIYIISDLINLFLSGFIFITIYNWLTNTKMELYLIGLWSLFINSLIKTFYTALHSVILTQINFNESLKILIYVITAVILSLITVKIRDSEIFQNILGRTYKKTINGDILNDVVDCDKRTTMIIYPKNSNMYYIGSSRLYEENSFNSYIVLINYALYSKENNELLRDFSKQKACIVINLHDIEHIELIYEDNSKKWEWLNKYN